MVTNTPFDALGSPSTAPSKDKAASAETGRCGANRLTEPRTLREPNPSIRAIKSRPKSPDLGVMVTLKPLL